MGIRGNIGALSESVNSKKQCSRVLSRECQFYSENSEVALLSHPLGDLVCDLSLARWKVRSRFLIYTSLFTVNGSMLGNKKLNYGKLERNKESVQCTIYSSYITHCQRIGCKQHCATDTQYEHLSQTA